MKTKYLQFLRLAWVCCILALILGAHAAADELPSAEEDGVAVLAAEDIDNIVANGTCGANMYWALDKTGVLTISGTGMMTDYKLSSSTPSAPWYGNSNYSYISTLIVNEGVTVIGTYAFYGLNRLTKVSLPSSLIRIKICAFQRCSSIREITIPNSVLNLEDGLFMECTNLLRFTIADTVRNIGASTFRGCNQLTQMDIPASVERIDPNAFQDCKKLKSVRIFSNLEVIKARTFLDCAALTDITIPGSVLIIEDDAFTNCHALSDIYFEGSEEVWNTISVDYSNQSFDKAVIHFDAADLSTYRINSITVLNQNGEELSKIPKSSFLATVSITNRRSVGVPLIFVAAYAENGQYQGVSYIQIREPVSGTVEVTIPVENPEGKIARIKAFGVQSFTDLTPLNSIVSYPAA